MHRPPRSPRSLALAALVLGALALLCALPAGAQWTSNTTVNTEVSQVPWVNDAPVMVRQGGRNFIAWSASGYVYLQHVDSSGAPAANDALVGLGDEPVLASDGAGGVIVAWTSIDKIKVQRYDSTLTPQWFGGPYTIAPGGGDQSCATLVADGAHVVAAWVDESGSARNVRAQKLDVAYGSPQWSPASTGLALNVNTTAAQAPAILPVGSRLWAAWASGGNGADLYLRLVDPAGSSSWTFESAIATTQDAQRLPQLVADGTGGVIVGWFDDVSPQRLFVQRFADQSGPPQVWSPASGIQIGSSVWSIEPENRVFSMDTDTAGGVVVAWSSASNIRYQRVRADGSLEWGSNGAQLTSTGGFYVQHVAPMVHSDGQSGALLSWHSMHKTANEYGDILAQFIHINHGPSWTAGGRTVSDAPGTQSEVAVTARNRCPSYYAWRDDRPNAGIYMHRITCPGLPHRVAIGTEPVATLRTHDTGLVPVVVGDSELWADGLENGRLVFVWDQEVLDLEEVVVGETMGDMLSVDVIDIAEGRAEIQFDGAITPQRGEVLFNLVFRTNEPGSTALSIPSAVLDNEPVAAGLSAVTVSDEDPDGDPDGAPSDGVQDDTPTREEGAAR